MTQVEMNLVIKDLVEGKYVKCGYFSLEDMKRLKYVFSDKQLKKTSINNIPYLYVEE